MTEPTMDQILAALESGDPVAAERLCRTQLQVKPDTSGLLVLLALSVWRQGRQKDALEIYARLTRLYPEDKVHWRNHAAALRKAGELQASELAYATAVQLAPEDAELLELYGLLQMELGKWVEARNTLLLAFGKQPDSPAIRIHAAQACSACRDSRAESLLAPWRKWLPLDDGLQFELAGVQIQQAEAISAMEVLEDLLRRSPSHVPARLSLASVYERVNRLGDAEAMLRTVEESGAQIDENVQRSIDRQRAQLAERRGTPAIARAILDRIGSKCDDDVGYWFALANACDKLGDTTTAMQALAAGHDRQIKEIKIAAPHLFESGVETLPNVDLRIGAADYRQWPELEAPDASQCPVFVVGFPRSGTTLLEQMLDAHPSLQSMDERPFINTLASQLENGTGLQMPRDLGRLDQRDCDELRKGYLVLACGKVPRRWGARLVDKNPLNMLCLPMIHRMFPRAKFILALRHPCDVILSCYMQNFRAAVLAVAGQTLEHLAHAYIAAMRNWLYHVGIFKPDVFVSRYEDLVADTPGQTRRIAAFLGLESADSMLKFDARARQKGFIKTPSYSQVIEPINRKSINRWQRYREYFEPVLPILQTMLCHWSYASETEQ
jgi:predicted Zn-dependent protease